METRTPHRKYGRHHRYDEVLACARERTAAVRPLPAALPPAEGQRGLCYVRQRLDEEVKLVSYGRSSGFCVDPIEKKPLNHFLPGTAGAVLRHRRLQPGLQVLPELGHEQVPRDGHAGRQASPDSSLGRASNSAAAASPSPTTTRSSSWSTPSTWPPPAASAASRSVAVTAGYIDPEPREEFFGHGRGQRRPEGLHRRFYRSSAAAPRPVLETLSTSATRPTPGWS
jgi:pyruvate formate lyase activating enzyme